MVFSKGAVWEQGVSPAAIPSIPAVLTLCPDKIGEENKLSKRTRKLAILIAAITIVMLLLAACTSTAATRGWAGATESNGKIIFASMKSKVYSIDSTTGSVLGNPITLQSQISGGFSLIPSCSGKQTVGVPFYASPTTGENIVYIGGHDGRVYAFALSDGKLVPESKWEYPRQGNVGSVIIGGLAVANGNVYLGSAGGTVYALTAADGYFVWSYNIGHKIWSSPIADSERVYIGGFDKTLYALNVKDGTKAWEFKTDGAISATPLLNNGIVYFGSYDRHFYAVDAATGKQVWKYPATDGGADSPGNWFWTQAVINGNVVYSPCLDGKVYALDASKGNLVKSYNFTKAISSTPAVVGDNVVVAATDLAKKTSKVFIINTTTNSSRELASFTEGINAPLFASNGTVYLHTTKDKLYGLNIQSGAVREYTVPN